jgi:hypothetical protein
MHLENRLRCTEKTHPLRKRDVLCVYIKSIYNKRKRRRERRRTKEEESRRMEEKRRYMCIYIYDSVYDTDHNTMWQYSSYYV